MTPPEARCDVRPGPPEPAPFDAPWQAQLFAMTVALCDAGAFTWPEWTETFGPLVRDTPETHYYDAWSDALVILLEVKGLARSDEIGATARHWQAAARATPHGSPITLDAAPAPKA